MSPRTHRSCSPKPRKTHRRTTSIRPVKGWCRGLTAASIVTSGCRTTARATHRRASRSLSAKTRYVQMLRIGSRPGVSIHPGPSVHPSQSRSGYRFHTWYGIDGGCSQGSVSSAASASISSVTCNRKCSASGVRGPGHRTGAVRLEAPIRWP